MQFRSKDLNDFTKQDLLLLCRSLLLEDVQPPAVKCQPPILRMETKHDEPPSSIDLDDESGNFDSFFEEIDTLGLSPVAHFDEELNIDELDIDSDFDFDQPDDREIPSGVGFQDPVCNSIENTTVPHIQESNTVGQTHCRDTRDYRAQTTQKRRRPQKRQPETTIEPASRKRARNTFVPQIETLRWHCNGRTKTYRNHKRCDGEWTECPNAGCDNFIMWDDNNLRCNLCKSKSIQMKQADKKSTKLRWRWVRCAAPNCKAMYMHNRGNRLKRSADKCGLLTVKDATCSATL